MLPDLNHSEKRACEIEELIEWMLFQLKQFSLFFPIYEAWRYHSKEENSDSEITRAFRINKKML